MNTTTFLKEKYLCASIEIVYDTIITNIGRLLLYGVNCACGPFY